jgi:hypothetical protein
MAPTIGVSGNLTFGTLNTISSNEARFYFNNLYVSQSSNTISVNAPSLYALSAGMSGGNTSGDGNFLANKSLYLAGGNNITLSNATGTDALFGSWQTVSISGPNMFRGGVSNIGNSVGTSGTASNQIVFAGGNNVTLSQSTGAGGNTITVSAANQTVQTQNLMTVNGTQGAVSISGGNNVTVGNNASTITISAANQTVQTQNLHNVTLSGNTAGVMAQISSGTLSLAGGNNITLSQNGNAVTISGGAGGAGVVLSGSNNSITSGTASFVNANGVSWSFNGQNISGSVNTSYLGSNASTNYVQATAGFNGTNASGTIASNSISVSVAAQSNQTVGLYANSNTTQSTSATVDARSLSFAGAGIASVGASNGSVVISVPAGGGAADGYNSAQFTNSTADSTMPILWAGNSNGSGNITMGLTGSTVTASAPAGGGGNVLDFYQNMDRGTSASLATAHRTLMLQRFNQENNEFGHDITANTFLLNMTANMTATSLSSSHSITVSLGIYLDESTRLTLINSATTTWGFTAATSNTANYHGPRWLSFVSSQWSSAPNFSSGNDYVVGVIFNSSNYGPPMSYIGQNFMHSLQRSGSIGTTVATNTSLAHGNYWNAMFTATRSSMPATIASNAVNRNNATAIFMPHMILNNRYSGTF